MGKKIPKSRKQKKLKFVDPCYTGAAPRSRKKFALTNEPPVAEDEQEMSRLTKEVIELKNKAKQNKLKRRKKKKKIQKDDFIIVQNGKMDNVEPGIGKPMKNIPSVIKQKKHESQGQFFNRLQKMADLAYAEAKVETKYNIEMVNVDNQGNAEYVTVPKQVTDKMRERRKKYKEKLEERRRFKQDDKEFDLKKEHVKFGEVASAPPVIKARPRKAPELNKAGKRQLALKEMLLASTSSVKKVTPLSMKWKSMPPDKRKIIEIERLRAVQMYRMMKNKKTT